MELSKTEKALKEMLTGLTQYYSWLHGKSDAVEVPDIALKAWMHVVENLDEDDISLAEIRCMQQLRWMPSPQEFVELVSQNWEEKAYLHWVKILHAIQLSPYDRVAIVDELPGAAKLALKSLGGTAQLAEMNSGVLHTTVRIQFCKLFETFSKSQESWKDDPIIAPQVQPRESLSLPSASLPSLDADIDFQTEQYWRSQVGDLIKDISARQQDKKSKKQGDENESNN